MRPRTPPGHPQPGLVEVAIPVGFNGVTSSTLIDDLDTDRGEYRVEGGGRFAPVHLRLGRWGLEPRTMDQESTAWCFA